MIGAFGTVMVDHAGQSSQAVNYLVMFFCAIVTGTAGWSVLQFVINRSGRKAEAARLTAQTEAEIKQKQLLIEEQTTAQRIPASAPRPRGLPDQPLFSVGAAYWGYALWTIVLGVILIVAPSYWYGPSWSYFPQMVHNGLGVGVCRVVLGSLQIIALLRNAGAATLSILLLASGCVYWTAGIVLGVEGMFGHRGLMEAPFMMYVGVHGFAHSAALMVRARDEKRPK